MSWIKIVIQDDVSWLDHALDPGYVIQDHASWISILIQDDVSWITLLIQAT